MVLTLWYWCMYCTGIVLVHGTDTVVLWYWYMLALLWSVEDNLPLAVSLWLLRLFCDINRTYCGVSCTGMCVLDICCHFYFSYFKHLNQVWYFTFQIQYFDFLSCVYISAASNTNGCGVLWSTVTWPARPPLTMITITTKSQDCGTPLLLGYAPHIAASQVFSDKHSRWRSLFAE